MGSVVPGVIVLGLVVMALSFANDWPLTRPLHRWWVRRGDAIRWYAASAPATFVYLGILAVTTWVLLGMPEAPRQAYIAAQSTNLAELARNPLRALVRSAFFVTSGELFCWLALFAALLAPVERWLGTARTITVFIAGHVGATLIAAVDVWIHITYLGAPTSLLHVPDTGASYGFAALAALLVYRLRGPSRLVLGLALACVVAYGVVEGTGFTARGHAAAVLIGLALRSVTRSPEVLARRGNATSLLDLWRRETADHPATPAAETAIEPDNRAHR